MFGGQIEILVFTAETTALAVAMVLVFDENPSENFGNLILFANLAATLVLIVKSFSDQYEMAQKAYAVSRHDMFAFLDLPSFFIIFLPFL